MMGLALSSLVAGYNTFGVLECRAKKCFEEYYACSSDKICAEEYSKFNGCMLSECLVLGEKQHECYSRCKQ